MTSTGLHPIVEESLDTVVARLATSEGILLPLRDRSNLATSARRTDPDHAFDVLESLVFDHRRDPLVGYLALHALDGVPSYRAAELLTTMLRADDPGAREHAAWALSMRRPHLPALAGLVSLTEQGGFARMTAELALEAWFREIPELAWRSEVSEGLRWLAHRPARHAIPPRRGPGLRIAQILMQGRVDAGLTSPGSGDGGGLITLQVGLTRELAKHPSVSEVFLVGRRVHEGNDVFSGRFEPITNGGTIARLGFGPDGYLPRAALWEHRAELERQLRRFLLRQGPFDAVHLRFADVGTFAATRVAEELGIPTHFTLAPDPHASISRMEQAGELTRDNFGRVDHEQHLVFRSWLVEHMLEQAQGLALLPRVDQERQLRELLDVDITTDPGRFTVIPEGVDLELVDEAREEIADGPPDVIVDLSSAIADLPESRQGLPLLLSVGRLATVKGMDRVVAAWAGDESLRSNFNLVLVGGDLDHPAPEEESVLAAIEGAMPGGGEGSSGLVLLGGRSHSDVSRVMAASAVGVGPGVGAGGVYVSGSEKEEFGLAIVEAMAAGLPVVAPKTGGPGTYVEHRVTGYLADTTDVDDIIEGIRWAEGVRGSEVRARAAKEMVRSRYSLATMADRLVELYSRGRSISTAL